MRIILKEKKSFQLFHLQKQSIITCTPLTTLSKIHNNFNNNNNNDKSNNNTNSNNNFKREKNSSIHFQQINYLETLASLHNSLKLSKIPFPCISNQNKTHNNNKFNNNTTTTTTTTTNNNNNKILKGKKILHFIFNKLIT